MQAINTLLCVAGTVLAYALVRHLHLPVHIRTRWYFS